MTESEFFIIVILVIVPFLLYSLAFIAGLILGGE